MEKTSGKEIQTKIIEVANRWVPQKIVDSTYHLWESSSVRVWFGRKKRMLSIGAEYADSITGDLPELPANMTEVPESIIWHNCVIEKTPTEFTILPVMPDRPILFNLESPVLLHGGSSTSVYIEIRTWLRFVSSSHSGAIIYEMPTVRPHKAWFGPTTTEGNICYWRKEKAAFSHMDTSGQPNLVVCPVTIYNRSNKNLSLDVIYLPVSRLSVFEADEGLVTDRVQVTYTGESEVSHVKVSGKAPPYTTSPRMITGPREALGAVESVMAGAMNIFTRLTFGDDKQV